MAMRRLLAGTTPSTRTVREDPPLFLTQSRDVAPSPAPAPTPTSATAGFFVDPEKEAGLLRFGPAPTPGPRGALPTPPNSVIDPANAAIPPGTPFPNPQHLGTTQMSPEQLNAYLNFERAQRGIPLPAGETIPTYDELLRLFPPGTPTESDVIDRTNPPPRPDVVPTRTGPSSIYDFRGDVGVPSRPTVSGPTPTPGPPSPPPGAGGGIPAPSSPRIGATPTGDAVGRIPPTDPAPFVGEIAPVGQDPLSVAINERIGDLLETGLGPRGSDLFEELQGIIDRGGDLDEALMAQRFESARELLDRGRRAEMNQLRATLASRGLLSEPGIPQGQEISAVGRLEERLGQDFARALRDIGIESQEAADLRLASAISGATGLATTEARTILDAIGEGTTRQQVLAEIALATLDRNMAWNQFLAEFGLQRDLVLESLQSGRLEDLQAILDLFARWFNLGQAGVVG